MNAERLCWTPLALLVLAKSSSALAASPFPAVLELSSLSGPDGFVLRGIDSNDASGSSVSAAGDVNGDGIDDVIVGAWAADPNAQSRAGESYVVFGRDTGDVGDFPSALELSALDGSNGFIIKGIDTDDFSGRTVAAAGDVNGDGVDDIIIGARGADPDGNSGAGETYVVFGRDTASVGNFPAALELSALVGSNGFVINGTHSDDDSAWSVSSAGDLNADGIADIIIGTPSAGGAFPYGGEGRCCVVFGRDTASVGKFPAALELSALDGSNGFAMLGIDGGDHCGRAVACAGDINGDDIDDVIMGAPFASPGGRCEAGESYVVFGRNTASVGDFPATLELSSLDGTNGFVINGVEGFCLGGFSYGDTSGNAVASAGDINGDGVDDAIIGAPGAYTGGYQAGASYILFGRDTAVEGDFPAALQLSSLDGSNGLAIHGATGSDRNGAAVSGAEDLNADGFDDAIIGAPGDGESYVLYGRDAASVGNFPALIQTSFFDGVTGFTINGGSSVSCAGDVNANGIADIIVGAPWADPNGVSGAGESYVVFGRAPSLCLGDLDGNGVTDVFDFAIFAPAFGTSLGDANYDPAADLDGNDVIDVFDFALFAPDFGCGSP